MSRIQHLILILFFFITASAHGLAANTKIRWGWYKVYQPVYVGIAKGYFKEQKIDLELTGPFTSGPAAVQAATTGNVDAAHSAITGLITATAEGFKLKAVADSQTEFKDAPLMRWYVKKQSGINSAKDLKGKTIAVNSFSGSFYFTIMQYLKKAGLTKNDVKFVNMPHPNQPQALLTGQIDVAGVIDPFSAQLEDDKSVKILTTGYDVLGENQFSVVFFTDDFLQKNPAAVAGFLKAYQKSVEFINQNPEEASKLIAKEIAIDPKFNSRHKYTKNAEVKTSDVEFWIHVLEDDGILKKKGSVNAADLVAKSK